MAVDSEEGTDRRTTVQSYHRLLSCPPVQILQALLDFPQMSPVD